MINARRLVPEAIARLTLRSSGPESGPESSPESGPESGPESSTATIGPDDLEWLAGRLMGLPWRFVVLEPPALRHRIAERATELAARHAPDV